MLYNDFISILAKLNHSFTCLLSGSDPRYSNHLLSHLSKCLLREGLKVIEYSNLTWSSILFLLVYNLFLRSCQHFSWKLLF